MGDLNFAELIGKLVIYFVVMLLAFSAHEAAHAWVSHKFGDNTAKDLGRMTLNPIPHIDPFGTILLPIITFILSGMGGFPLLLGYPKPTPINSSNWQNYNKANFWVSSAGVLANLFLVFLGLIGAKIMMGYFGLEIKDLFGSIQSPVGLLFGYMMSLNLSLFVLNLLPLPPFDGAEIFKSILPTAVGDFIDSIAPYSFFILLGLMFLGIFKYIMMPFFIVLLLLLQI